MARRTLAEWLAWQEQLHPATIELGLERIRTVLERLELTRPAPQVFIVGGTNGKGSCVAALEALAMVSGRRTGAYTSPHLLRYNERVRIDGEEVDDAALVSAFEAVEAARGDVPLTYFEFGTAAALQIFRRRAVETAVLEIGLGGRLDAVNAVAADAAIVTSVGLDHMEWLGPDRESIGREKGGIFRAGKPAVIGERDPPATLLAAAGAGALRLGVDFDWDEQGEQWRWHDDRRVLAGLPLAPLPAPALRDNAASAIAAFAALEPRLAAADAAEAIGRIRLAGRLQRVPGPVEWWLDVAHNPAAAAMLAGALAAAPGTGRTWCVLGMLGDKDAGGVAAALAPQVDGWFLASLEPPRGLSAAALAERLPAPPRAEASSVAEACELARRAAAPGDRIVVCGSFHTVGPALEWLGYTAPPRPASAGPPTILV
ncbi:bifunctional tetrahydrofolate synthase/dihydrofolate synthase [Thioalkalivibrio sp. XN8]|uniref:bifunctional tetrahydrofolate synthase/dihydrofolate synthase n=1 Tax=Thioalkalivibrio sp. XN8 TaxID=2712863 RepID=UPI0013E9B771|nr:bifunctional tetrahydrofolate synthase/dihydrofolate synthase [Thioalkalivibrio sp. XN8]NGP52271.1 bifunctional tetrahydrofolate synthase/dihydrofolate synthase [Thioalkalivibrio sp. XN8]